MSYPDLRSSLPPLIDSNPLHCLVPLTIRLPIPNRHIIPPVLKSLGEE